MELLNSQIVKSIFPTVIMLIINICIVVKKSRVVAVFFALVVPLQVLFMKFLEKICVPQMRISAVKTS